MSDAFRLPSNVCSGIVRHDCCIGCGVCAGICPASNLAMRWTPGGQLAPVDDGRCLDKCHLCLQVCPFGDHHDNEDTLAGKRFGDEAGIRPGQEAGLYLSAWAGHVTCGEFRHNGASGGLASWFLTELLHQGIVDRVICVIPHDDPEQLFRYAVCETPEQVRHASGSAYYPVELSEIVRVIATTDARYAVIGLPCFLKALSLAMQHQPRLARRIVLLAGLVCGQLKSRGFSDFLARHAGLSPGYVRSLRFRQKTGGATARDFVVRLSTEHATVDLPRLGAYSTAWMSGQFQPRACLYCDDVFAEVADVTFMDAWLDEYASDGGGNSIALVRSALARQVIEPGIADGRLSLTPVTIEQVLASQAGVIAQKRQALAERLWLADQRKQPRPAKRVEPRRPALSTRLRLEVFERLRLASHRGIVEQNQASPKGLETYQRAIGPHLRQIALLPDADRLRRLPWGLMLRGRRWLHTLTGRQPS